MSSTPHTTIAMDAPGVTLINVFTVDPTRQEELVDALDRVTAEIYVTIPGFISANFHASLDGTCVVNYAQWASVEHFEAMHRDPRVLANSGKIARIANKVEPRLFTVRTIHHPQ